MSRGRSNCPADDRLLDKILWGEFLFIMTFKRTFKYYKKPIPKLQN